MGKQAKSNRRVAPARALVLLGLAAFAAMSTSANARATPASTDGFVSQAGEDSERDDRDGLPGGGVEIRMARPTWDTGWFQAEILDQLLRELGYDATTPVTYDNQAFYDGLVDERVDIWANGWFPLHEPFVDGRDEIVPVGLEVDDGALQGYMIDIATADRLGIDDLGDLADPDIARAFDRTGDGVADLVGCNPEWSCGPIVDHHLDAFGLADTVEQVQGSYGPQMQAAVGRFQRGRPVLYYNFTPNWTTGELIPGRDVMWLPVPFASLPDGLVDQEPDTVVAGVEGCRADPCSLGFAPNDIRAVTAQRILDDHPAIRQLLTDFAITLDDIETQNARLVSDRPDADDVALHAEEWIAENRASVDIWIESAITAHVDAGLELSDVTVTRRPGVETEPVGPVDVVTRVSPPFVTFEDNRFDGFAIDVWDAVALRVGAEYDIVAVNSSVKLVDEVVREEADVGVGATGITSIREERVNFTHSFIESGLQIMVGDDDDGFLGGAFGAIAGRVFSLEMLAFVLVLLGALAVAAHVVWWTERGRNPDFPESYRDGIWEAFWWAAVTATTVGYGDRTPKGRTGRLVGLVWMFAGLFLIAYVTAGIASTLTVEEIANSIDSVDDLRSRDVAVPAGSEAEAQLARLGVPSIGYPTADDAYDALRSGDVDAVVHDAAVLRYEITRNPADGVRLVGAPFDPQQYGFVVRADDPLRERLNRALLDVIESGDYSEIYERWFGVEPDGG